MKKIVFMVYALGLLAGLSGCQKEYHCTQVVTRKVNDVQIDRKEITLYSENCLDGTCFNYEQWSNDTVTISQTTCK
ncbi:MAG TPA: lipoprotein [Bacteroidales bacterium]|nr:lipoprotein [Bacteroidales bacterium]